MPPAPIVAFGFANLAMLGWLAAAAAPILIHLWMRQTHRETAWAAVRFLRAALERQARKLRLQHWLLLAVRTLLLAFVALAAAKPFLDDGLWAGGAPTHRVLVVDASMSMNAVDDAGRTGLERAKQAALAIVDAARAGDTHSLVVMGADSGAPLGRPVADRATARSAIEAIAPSLGVADLREAFAAASRLVAADSETATGRRQEVVVLSDLGANTWAPLEQVDGEADPRGGLFNDAYDTLAESARLSVIDTGATGPNAAVTALSLPDDLPTLSAPIEIRGEATWHADTATAPVERVAELWVDDSRAAERRITLTSGQPTPIDFTHRFGEAGPRSVEIRLTGDTSGGDRLADDNRRYVALDLAPKVRVLCVAGAPGAASYLADALDPGGEAESIFEPVVVSDADLPTVELNRFACVFLSNVREVSASEAERLLRYVQRGGGVAFFVGDRVSSLRYNESLAPPRELLEAGTLGMAPRAASRLLRRVSTNEEAATESNEAVDVVESLLPGWLSAPVTRPAYGVDPLDYDHPITRPFRGQERAGLLTTPVARYMPLTLQGDGANVSVALALAGGDPLLVTADVGRGRTAILTTAATLSSIDAATGEPWTALPAWPSFLPIVRGLVAHLAGGDGVGAALSIGEVFQGSSDRASIDVRVEPPAGAPMARVTPDADGVWTYVATQRAGVYRYGRGDEPVDGAFAVNVESTESNPARVRVERLPNSLTVRAGAAGDAAGGFDANAPTPIHRWLLYAALALALVEPAMACLFGRGDA